MFTECLRYLKLIIITITFQKILLIIDSNISMMIPSYRVLEEVAYYFNYPNGKHI